MRPLALALVLALPAAAFADSTPPAPTFVLAHEGRLLDGTDQPVTGSKNVTFGLTANATPPASGADTFVWQATYAVNFDDQGHYAVMLGNVSNAPGTTTPNPPLTAAVLAPMATAPLYLAITVDQTPLTPRLQLAPAPLSISSLDSNHLQGHPASDFALAADTYTKTEVDSLINTQATQAVSALSDSVNAELATKADASNTYTKSEVDSALATKENATDAAAALALKADSATLTADLATKADASSVYSKSDIDSKLANYDTTSDVSSKLAGKVSTVTAGDNTITIGGSATSPTVAVNKSNVQARVTASCSNPGEAITAINADGTVTCSPMAPQRVVRWMTFNTYDQQAGWYGGNSTALFGGVNPSNWTDGNYRAVHMTNDVDIIRTLLTRKAYVAAPNAVINADTWVDVSSTNGRVTVALMRVKNSTPSAINWQLCFYYTAYSGWGEYAGLALNGNEIWNSATGYATSNACSTMSLPGNRISTVIISATSSPPWNNWGYLILRNNFLAFYNNSLNLPSGLSFVDDLDYLPSGTLW